MTRPWPARVAARVRAGVAVGVATGVGVTALSVPAVPATATEPPPGSPGRHSSQDAPARAPATPLKVSIETMNPSTLPRRGNVVLSGEITNRSRSTWTDLSVFLFASEQPMTTAAELAEATATDDAADVGPRLTRQGLYARVPDLEPGESSPYTLSVPRSAIPGRREGVYWLGVHVLGTSEKGRISGADGRARTFIPLLRDTLPRMSLSLVMPIKARVTRTRDGTLGNLRTWERRLGSEGRLDRLLDLSATSGDVSLTWLVDPAVLEAARSVAAGDPPFDMSPTDRRPRESSPSPDDGAVEDPGVDADEAVPPPGEGSTEADAASEWIESFLRQSTDHALVHVPYGDLDVAAVLRAGETGLLARADELAAATVTDLALESTPVVAPADGLLPNVALEHLEPSRILLLSQAALATEASVLTLPQNRRVAVASDVARTGAPPPPPRFGALALRQRILAEAAAHALTGPADQPLVVTTPETWNPGGDWRSAQFFAGLEVPWLRTLTLPSALTATPQRYDGPLRYARTAKRLELPVENVWATKRLLAAGTVLASLLARNDTIDDQVGRAAMLTSSFHARQQPGRAVTRAAGIADRVADDLEKVYVEGSALVTMSSETGNFSVTVVNGLAEPVTVGIKARTGTDRLKIRSPDLVTLGPGQRASVRLSVTATETGVHSVEVTPTTPGGRPLGRSTRIKVRSSQVGFVIWLILGTGGALFVTASGVRVLRRVRTRKRTHGPLLKDTTA